ncbi:putative C6 transcription factor [Hypoxylon rubiginosum]|uniref:C6 transcription factor n=1 Tax=Hypoxylon rubiginosum TaxID=110542 RepID=A0ACB9Z7I4_9PEZI|nr:putative C6 transcription factor [Hypoxylon rubiginosum]
MAGARKKARSVAAATSIQHQSPIKTSIIVTDSNLGYKIRVLLYDFRNVRTDHASQERLSLTVDPLYISSPYFTQEEAACVRAATVDTYTENNEDPDARDPENNEKAIPIPQSKTVEDMLHTKFAKFLEKRRASGDSRPCGPHDMAPIYESIFGISQTKLEDENFLCRLRKSGLQTDQNQNKSADEVGGKKKRGGH